MIAVSAKVKKKKSKKSKSKSPRTTVIEESLLGNSEGVPTLDTLALDSDKPVPLKESASSSSSRLSLDSMTEDGHAPLYVALTTPHDPHDLVSGEAMAAANATALVLSASTPQHTPATQHTPVTSVDEVSADAVGEKVSTQQSPDSEMRTAILALSKMKDELELQNRLI